MFVIQRSDGKFVCPPGFEHSYSNRLQDAIAYVSRDEAESELCAENERVVPIEALFARVSDSPRRRKNGGTK